MKAAITATNLTKNQKEKVIIKEYETHFEKDFILKEFEDYTSNELSELYKHYSDNSPAEFKPKENEDKKKEIYRT